MREKLMILAALAACSGSGQMHPFGDDDTDAARPSPDARASDARVYSDASPTISGRACILLDPRALGDCADTGYAGITIALDGASASVGPDGTFSIASPTSSSPTWRVSGASITTSLVGFTELAVVPVMTSQLYGQLTTHTGVAMGDGGAVLVHVLHAGSPEELQLVSVGSDMTYYAGSDPTNWSSYASTGSAGAAWIPNTTTGEVTIAAGSATVYATTEAGALTFVTVSE